MLAVRLFIRLIFFGSLIIASMQSLRGTAQDETDASHFVEAASEYHFGIAGKPDFELRKQPVMVWSNPATFDQKGALFVWLNDGRPEVIGTFYDSVHSGMPRSTVELHSLADGPIKGRFREVEFWHPTVPGLKFQPVGGNVQAASTPSRLALQLRQISREFEADLTNRDGSNQPLRLLPNPLLTYSPKSGNCTHGAIFAFAAIGTDPDVFLIIEDRKVDGKLGLYYACARFHFRKLVAKRNGETVWSAEAKEDMTRNFRTSPTYRDSPYTFFRVK